MNRFARSGPKTRKAKDRAGAALIGLALFALAAMALAGFALRPPPSDPVTLCRTDQPLAAHTYILVDATDRLEPRHRRRLRAIVQQEHARLARYDRLSIASLRADRPQEPRVLFSLCDPGDGRDANPLYQNTRRAQARWDAAFGDALDRAVRRASGGRAANASPIVAGVRAVAADPDFGGDIPARRLVLVSDLLEYGPRFSLYEDGADLARLKSRAPELADFDLHNVGVRVAMLDRPEQAARQRKAVEDFWRPLLDHAGARAVTFDPTP
ncbi:MAG: hypothetical protein JNJ73_17730 [Hyphomonadaceae bacterium]|nr:hypothetical protein [Hyphomonadaceae bacterium]